MKSDVVISDDRLEMTRFFAYPRSAVFEAWTDPEQIELWWGCRDTERVECSCDARPGGEFRYVMHLKNGITMAYEGTYTELVVPEKIVTKTSVGAGAPYAFESETTIEFTEEDGGTRLKLTQIGLPPVPDSGKIIAGGTTDSFDKLDRHLAARQPSA